jgi:hypothetical protein
MKKENYKATQTNRFYPGRISKKRQQALANFEIPIDELGVDDIVFMIGKNLTHAVYSLLDIIRTNWGEEAMIEAAKEYGYRRAKAGYAKWLKKHGVKAGTPELMAAYQDYAHATTGPAPSTVCTTYDDEKVVIRRTECAYHTHRPENMKPICAEQGEGFMKGYMEADKNFIKTEKPFCLACGDEFCERTFWFKKG